MPTKPKRTVYVVSTRTTSTGGFEWRYTLPAARQFHEEELKASKRFEDYETHFVGAVEVPDGLTGQAITDWLDERPEVWDFTPSWED